jgi:hypothetical protein
MIEAPARRSERPRRRDGLSETKGVNRLQLVAGLGKISIYPVGRVSGQFIVGVEQAGGVEVGVETGVDLERQAGDLA